MTERMVYRIPESKWKYSTTQLRSVTCHMWSHSVTCYPTPLNTPRLNPSHTGRYSIYLPRRDGRLSWPSWLDSAPPRPGVEQATFRSRVQRSTTAPPRQLYFVGGILNSSNVDRTDVCMIDVWKQARGLTTPSLKTRLTGGWTSALIRTPRYEIVPSLEVINLSVPHHRGPPRLLTTTRWSSGLTATQLSSWSTDSDRRRPAKMTLVLISSSDTTVCRCMCSV